MKKVLTIMVMSIMILSTCSASVIAQKSQDDFLEANHQLSSLETVQLAYNVKEIDYDECLLLKYYAIYKPEKLPEQYKSAVPVSSIKSATPLILEIRENWDRLSLKTQGQLSFAFKRPTEVNGGIDNNQHILPKLYTSPEGNFTLHWTNGTDGGLAADAPPLADGDGDSVPDYVENFAAIFDNVWAMEINNPTYGYHQPPSDAAKPNDGNNTNPDGKYDIFIINMVYYGYADPEQHPNSPSYSYIAVDNDYAGFGGVQLENMQVTAAHEFFHAIQFYYDCTEGSWWKETTAVWMEDEVYDNVNDYLQYLPSWFANPDISLTNSTAGTHEYGNCIFAKFLSEKKGTTIIKDMWEEMVNSDGLTAIDNVLQSDYGTDLETVFSDFAVANYLNGNNNHDGNFANDQYEEGDLYDDIKVESTKTYNGGEDPFLQKNLPSWSSAYYKIDKSNADTLYFKNDKDFYTTSIRTAPSGTTIVRSLSNVSTGLNESQLNEIQKSSEYQKMLKEAGENATGITASIQKAMAANTITSNTDITANNTVTNADKYDNITIVVSPLDKSGDYTLTLDEVQKIENSIQPGQSAIYVIPAYYISGKGAYLPKGDVFTSVWWESARNIDVDLTPVGFTSTVDDIPSGITLKNEKIGKNRHWLAGWSIWKLDIEESGTGMLADPIFKITSNYYDGQMHQLPTVLEVAPVDMNAGSNVTPSQISFDVLVFDGSVPFEYAPFDPPTSSNFEVKIGGKPANSIIINRDTISLHKYHVNVMAPPQDTTGKFNLSVNFTFSKFGVSNTANISKDDMVEYTAGGNADISIVIDSSGSMDWNDPSNMRKAAAKLFTDLANDDDQIAIIDFDSSARVWKDLTLVKGNKSSIKAAIDKVDSSGGTNILKGLQYGYNQLNGANANPSNRKAAILLTDGQGTDPAPIIPSYVAKGWPVYTIGLTSGTDEALMKSIASSTGGKYYSAPTNAELQQIYNEISQTIKKQNVIQTKSGSITQGETIQSSVQVDSTVKSMDFSLTWPGSDLNLTLFYPNKTQVQLNVSSLTGTEDSNITYTSAATYEIYSLTNPLPGNWTYNITAIQTVGPEPYDLSIAASTTTVFSASVDKATYFNGEPVTIIAAFMNNTGGIMGASVTANITLPNSVIDTVILADNGDGSYEVTFANTTTAGTYKIKVEAIKEEITRQKSLTFDVSSSSIGIAVTPSKLDLASYPGTKVSIDVNVTNRPGGSMLSLSEFQSSLEEIPLVKDSTNGAKMSLKASQSSGGVVIQPNDLVSEKGYVIDAANIVPSPSVMSIPDGQNGTTTITINIPRYAPIGNYTGTVRFVSPDGSILTPVNVTIQKSTMNVILSYITESYTKWRSATTSVEKDYYVQKMADDLVMAYYT